MRHSTLSAGSIQTCILTVHEGHWRKGNIALATLSSVDPLVVYVLVTRDENIVGHQIICRILWAMTWLQIIAVPLLQPKSRPYHNNRLRFFKDMFETNPDCMLSPGVVRTFRHPVGVRPLQLQCTWILTSNSNTKTHLPNEIANKATESHEEGLLENSFRRREDVIHKPRNAQSVNYSERGRSLSDASSRNLYVSRNLSLICIHNDTALLISGKAHPHSLQSLDARMSSLLDGFPTKAPSAPARKLRYADVCPNLPFPHVNHDSSNPE